MQIKAQLLKKVKSEINQFKDTIQDSKQMSELNINFDDSNQPSNQISLKDNDIISKVKDIIKKQKKI